MMTIVKRYRNLLLPLITIMALTSCGKEIVFDGEILSRSKVTPGMTNYLVKVFHVEKGQLTTDTIELSRPETAVPYKAGIYTFYLRKDPQSNINTPEVLTVDAGESTPAKLAIDSLSIVSTEFRGLKEALNNPERVYKLDLYLTQLDPDLSNLTKFKNVRTMDLRGTAVTPLPDAFDQFEHLERLSIALDDLTVIPPSVLKLPNLRELSIYGPDITELPSGWGNLRDLTRLTITNTGITALPADIAELPKLTALLLIRNKISTLPEVFPEFPLLEQLNVSDNAITQLPLFRNCPKLKWVTANKNAITNVPAHIFENQSLRRLNVANNQIRHLEFPARCPQPHYALNLRNNPIQTIPETICNLQWLSNLDLSDLPQEVKLPDCLMRMQIKSIRTNENTNPKMVKKFQEEGYQVSVSSS